ncbi:hypothetical protein D9M68_650320 [compost metagenome]
MVGEHVAVVLHVLAELGVLRVFQPGLELGQHLVERQLLGRVGSTVAQRDVGRRAGRHTEADAHDLGAHLVERGGFGVHRHQVGREHALQPGVEQIPGQDGVVGQVGGALGAAAQVGLVEQAWRAIAGLALGLGLVFLEHFRWHVVLRQRAHQALEAVLFAERHERLGILPADRDGLQRGQAFDVVLEIAVGLDGEQLAPLGQPIERVAQVLARHTLDFARARHQRFQRAVFEQPFHGGLGTDLGHTRHVVHLITHQGLVVQHQTGRHAEFGRHAGDVAPSVVHRVDHRDVLVDQLAQVLVTAGDDAGDALLRRHVRERADHVVGLHAGHIQHLPAQQLHHLVDGADLRAQVVGHG